MTNELAPAEARRRLGLAGRLMYDVRGKTIWERDTATLPRVFRRLRVRYREFAESHIAPLALAADLDPVSVDVRRLFVESARRGFQTELLPAPLGTMKYRALARSFLLGQVLKAEEFCASCGGLGNALLAHELGMAPMFVCGDLGVVFGLMRRIYREIRAGEAAIGAFAITEPEAGSDVEETEGAATARIGCRATKVDGGWRISGRKVFISNGAIARWVTLFAAEQGGGVESWSCYLLDKSMDGFSVGRSAKKMGQRAADASELSFEEGWKLMRNFIGE